MIEVGDILVPQVFKKIFFFLYFLVISDKTNVEIDQAHSLNKLASFLSNVLFI